MEREHGKELAECLEMTRTFEAGLARVLVGQKETIRGTLIALLAGGHILLEGVPGLGKTLLVRTLAELVEGKFSRIQFTPDLMPADLTGTNLLIERNDGTRCFDFQPGPLFANVVLADEINRATPKTQAALLEAMQERSITVGGTTHSLDALFFVLATQNPLEMEGTYPLPEAQLDRFFAKLLVPYPSEQELIEIMRRTGGLEDPSEYERIHRDEILSMRRFVRQVPVAEEMVAAIASLIMRSHPENDGAPDLVRRYVRYGASPRGAQALLLGARIQALLEGRFNVDWEDVASLAPMILRHRILLNFEGQAESMTTDTIVHELLKKTDHV